MEDRACSTLLHRLVFRVPKATLDILVAYAEDLFRAIFGLELDCGKLWRRKSLGTGVYQPEDPWEVRERLLVHQPEDPWPEDPWEVRERLRVHQPEDPWEVRTAFSMLPRRFRDSRRLEAWLKGRKRKTGRARRCCTDLFYGFRKQRSVRASALLYANSCYLRSSKFATVTDVVCVCTVVCSLRLLPFL